VIETKPVKKSIFLQIYIQYLLPGVILEEGFTPFRDGEKGEKKEGKVSWGSKFNLTMD
jgi:hypothetical protein